MRKAQKLFYMKNSTQNANMNTDTLRTQGSYFIQSIKSIILIAAMLITTFGNHTFATLGNPHRLDSNKHTENSSPAIGDEIGNTKISLPSIRSFYRADREINRNMANEIKQLYLFRFELPAFIDADQTIQNLFLNEYRIQFEHANGHEADEIITNEFYASNIDQNISKALLLSDNEINNSFIKSYSVTLRSNVSLADTDIHARFHVENN